MIDIVRLLNNEHLYCINQIIHSMRETHQNHFEVQGVDQVRESEPIERALRIDAKNPYNRKVGDIINHYVGRDGNPVPGPWEIIDMQPSPGRPKELLVKVVLKPNEREYSAT